MSKTTSKTTSKTANTKRSNTRDARDALFVIDQKGAEVDARSVPTMPAAEIRTAGQMGDAIQRALALNIIAGKVDPALMDKKQRDKTFTRSQRTDKSRFVRLLELDRAKLAEAWNKYQETRKIKRAISLSGLVAAAKEMGLIEKGEAPAAAKAADAGDVADLAARIVAIMATPRMTAAAKLAAIAELPEIMAVGA